MRRPRCRIALLAAWAALAPLVAPRPAAAWGPQGHRVIARVALERLTPEARAAIKDLLHPGDTLFDIAPWADHEGHDVFPGSAPWHYVNIPITDARYRDGRDARRADNVVHKIEHYRQVLADRKASHQDRQTALLFLVHFVADVHQPLHVGDNDDRGGNQTQVRFDGRGTNLHQLWDSGLMRHIGGNDQAWVGRVDRAIIPDAARRWSREPLEAWADESLRAAKVAYQDLAGNPRTVESGYTLGDGYVRQVEPILVEQLARASVRLADELNAALGPATERARPREKAGAER